MTSHTGKLEGKRALVTGSGTGIGREVALEFARQGADVVIHYASSQAGAESACEEIKTSGRRAGVLRADLSEVEACFRLVDAAAKFLGGLDILVNNAGICAWLRQPSWILSLRGYQRRYRRLDP
jgi:NAD(P)-dependent dehydrogenase (short-subunit alcohol dehydrogenase family)